MHKIREKIFTHWKGKAAFLGLVLGMTILSGGRTAQAAQTQDVSGTAGYTYAFQVLTLVNEKRAAAGVDALQMDSELLDAAMLRAAELEVSFSHTRPNGQDCFSASSKMYGENIAWGQSDPEDVMDSWMNSTGHRQNILASKYHSIGIGCLTVGSNIYWVQCFGQANAVTASQPADAQVTYRVAKDTDTQTVRIQSTPGSQAGTSSPAASASPKPGTSSPTPKPNASSTPKPNGTASIEDPNTEESTVTVPTVTLKKLRAHYVKKKSKKNWLKVTWKCNGKCTGYQVWYSSSPSMKKHKSYLVRNSAKKQKYIRNIAAGKWQYVKVRAYTVVNGKKQYGAWSARGSVWSSGNRV